jgi:rubrerythrin
MHDMTAGNLRSAHGGESMAHMRYAIWAEQAQREGFANVARLFRAISFAEQVHATGHFKALRNEGGAFAVTAAGGFGLGATSDNLAGAIEGELFEIREMYPAYLEVARMQGERRAVTSMTYAVEAEKIHAALYARAKKAVDAGKDPALKTVQICEVCGHTVEGDAPGVCPICKAKARAFRAFAA